MYRHLRAAGKADEDPEVEAHAAGPYFYIYYIMLCYKNIINITTLSLDEDPEAEAHAAGPCIYIIL